MQTNAVTIPDTTLAGFLARRLPLEQFRREMAALGCVVVGPGEDSEPATCLDHSRYFARVVDGLVLGGSYA